MNKEFIPYEQALTLKELGFDEPCFGSFFNKTKNFKFIKVKKQVEFWTSAPLYQQAFKWFRKRYNLHANINPVSDSTVNGFTPNGKYSGTIDDVTIGKEMQATDTVCVIPICNSYEEAELECLRKLIEIVKNK